MLIGHSALRGLWLLNFEERSKLGSEMMPEPLLEERSKLASEMMPHPLLEERSKLASEMMPEPRLEERSKLVSEVRSQPWLQYSELGPLLSTQTKIKPFLI